MKYVLWIGCVMKFISVASIPNESSQKQLEMSLHQVTELLSEIDAKISRERKLLSQYYDENNREGAGKGRVPAPTERPFLYKFGNSDKRNEDPKISNIVSDWLHITSENRHHKGRELPGQRQQKMSPGVIGDGLPELSPGWPFEDNEDHNATYMGSTTANPLKIDMLYVMQQEIIGYCSVFMKQFFAIMAKKPIVAIQTLFEVVADILWKLKNPNVLNCMDDLLRDRVMSGAILVKSLPGHYLRGVVQRADYLLQNRNTEMDKYIDQILTTYDFWFDENEGNQLLDTLVEFNNYYTELKPVELRRVEQLCEDMVVALLAPANIYINTKQLQNLNDYLNRLYELYYPNHLRSLRTGSSNNTEESASASKKHNHTTKISSRRVRKNNDRSSH